MATTTSPADPKDRALLIRRSSFKKYSIWLTPKTVSERRSPPFPGGTHARRVAPEPRLGTSEPQRGGTDSTLQATGARRRRSPRLGAAGERPCGRPRAQRPRSGPQRGGLKPPVLGPRASDAGKCPHPGNPRLTAAAAAATRSGRQNGGGGGDGLVLRGQPGPRDPASGRAGRPQLSRRVSPALPLSRTPSDPRGSGEGRAPARRGAGPSGPWPLSRSPALSCRLTTSIVKDFNIPGNVPSYLCSEGIS